MSYMFGTNINSTDLSGRKTRAVPIIEFQVQHQYPEKMIDIQDQKNLQK